MKRYNKDYGIAALVATILASGGIGVLLSTLHHAWHWNWSYLGINHSQLLVRLQRAGILRLINASSGKPYDPQTTTPNRQDAWIITTSLWHGHLGENDAIKGAETKVLLLMDLAHSTGTVLVASLAGWIIALVLVYHVAQFSLTTSSSLHFVLGNLTVGLLSLVHLKNARKTSRLAQSVVDQVLTDALAEEQRKKKSAVETWVVLDGD